MMYLVTTVEYCLLYFEAGAYIIDDISSNTVEYCLLYFEAGAYIIDDISSNNSWILSVILWGWCLHNWWYI